jgi:CBS domain-containing protein
MATGAAADDAVRVTHFGDSLLDSASAGELRAHQVASRAAVTVSRAQTLREAAKLMAAHGTTHLVVINEASGHPVGVLASNDILQAYAASAAIHDKE